MLAVSAVTSRSSETIGLTSISIDKVSEISSAVAAISALMAAYFLLFSRRKPPAIGPVPQIVVHMAWLMAAWIGINLLSQLAFAGTALGIAIWAHIGGFAAGLLLAVPLVRSHQVRRPRHDIP